MALSAQSRDLAATAWAELQAPLDRQLSPLGLAAMDALAPRPGETVVDIGCGAGQTALQLAERVGAAGHVVGVDIAPRLVEAARARTTGAPNVSFVIGDAQALDLPPVGADGVFSRFGVMAFADPVAAFTGFHRALRPGGRLAFVCWRALGENEVDLLPLRAAGLEDRVDLTPFSFEDPDRIGAVLTEAGFRDVGVAAHDAPVCAGNLETTLEVVLRVGALGRILRENPSLRPAAEPRVRTALAARGDPAAVSLAAATWVVTAQA